ncbi:hypothetical protein [Pontiella sulfatireligans]|uniref:MAM domain-containing protein n=1 Tax=Pontiella sulfatireligans TaxID=2750658 RepID=A0A6C2UGS0_9BACT|nr:hypothetical protein [Pontiella sulfatireligans]VGO19380.1 hypothetical protein SCARR_01438 [Pontiella sulfatireligans]
MRRSIWVAALLMGASLGWGQSITVNPTNYRQVIDMMGGDMERSSKAIQNASNKAEMIQWGFGDIAFNTCRVQYDKNQELEEGTKNWAFYDKQVATMQQIKAVNSDIRFFATLRSDYDGYGDNNNLPDWFCNYSTKVVDTDKYGIFLADYVEYMSQQGVPVDMMCIAKEWKAYFPAAVAKDVIIKLNSELNARGVAVPLISDQGFWNLSGCISYIEDVASLGTEDLYWSFSCHDYQNQGLSYWMTVESKAAALSKSVYNDESSHGGGGPTYGEEPEISKPIGAYVGKCEMYAAGIKGEMMFEIWSRGINRETRPIYCPSGGTGVRKRGYYIMKLFANHAVDSTYITSDVESMSDVHTMAFRKNDQIVLWVINEGTNSFNSVPIALDASAISGSVNGSFWTADTSITGSASSHPASGSSFVASIPAESLNCYIFNIGTPGVPYAESFESGFGAWTQSADDDFDWTRWSGYTPTTNTGPSAASDGTGYLYIEGNDDYNGHHKIAQIESIFDFSTATHPELIFDYHMYGVNIDYLAVDVSDGTSWTSNVWMGSGPVHTNSESAWSNAVADLSAYAGNDEVTIRFRAKEGYWHVSDVAIDNILVQEHEYTPYELWGLDMFAGAAGGTDASAEGNPDGDANANGLEWILATDPLVSDSPITSMSFDDPNWIITYTRRVIDGVSVYAEFSPELPAPSWGTTGLTEVVIGGEGEVETVAVLLSCDLDYKFIRLRVEQ